jgi:type II secretion system protein H
MRPSVHTTSGFTLIELIAVLVIIAISCLAVAPMLGSFVRGRAPENTAGRFVAIAHWARSQAISDGAIYRVNLDANAGTWSLTMDNGTAFVAVETTYGDEFTVPDDVRIESDAPKIDKMQVIEFDPTGRSDPGTVKFLGTRGGEVDVVCDTPADTYHIDAGAK